MNRLKTYYPQILVTLQFGIIAIMMLLGSGFFDTFLPMVVFGVGVVLGVWALSHNQLGNFHIQPKLKEDSTLVTTGIYRYIRHPMYSSVLMMMLSFVIALPSSVEISLFLALVVVLWLKARREEMLWSDHSPEYVEYQKSSRFIIPFLL